MRRLRVNFVNVDAKHYGRASRTNGGEHACANLLRVARTVAESKLLMGINTELQLLQNVEAFKSEVRRILTLRRANASGAAVDRTKRFKGTDRRDREPC